MTHQFVCREYLKAVVAPQYLKAVVTPHYLKAVVAPQYLKAVVAPQYLVRFNKQFYHHRGKSRQYPPWRLF